MRTLMATIIGATIIAGAAPAASAQSSASTYSYGTYNPVQAAINRNSMNAAIIRQATGKRAAASRSRAPGRHAAHR